MKTLEEYLIEEGILELFLENIDNEDNPLSINSAFDWSETKEGSLFWNNHYGMSKRLDVPYIRGSRINELVKNIIPRFRKGMNA